MPPDQRSTARKPGLSIGANGQIYGTPTTPGSYWFTITAYTFENNWWDDDEIRQDSEWFHLFVTEASSNSSCANPDSESITELYACAGLVEHETLDAGTEFEFDINYFVDFKQRTKLKVSSFVITLQYDANYFLPAANTINSQLFREAGIEARASLEVLQNIPGTLTLKLTAQNDGKGFIHSGRMLDLIFEATQNVPAGEYPVTISIDEITSKKDPSGLVEVSGAIQVLEDVEVEDDEADEEIL